MSQTWTDWLRPSSVNWANFTLIQITGEVEWVMNTVEVELGLLNFNVFLTYYWPSETRDDLKRTARLVEAGLLETVPLELSLSADAIDPHVTDPGKPSTRA